MPKELSFNADNNILESAYGSHFPLIFKLIQKYQNDGILK